MTKRKSEKRFEQLDHIMNEVIPSLRSGKGRNPGYESAVLYACWASSYTVNRLPQFNSTKDQLSEQTRIPVRTVQRILARLEKGGVIRTIKLGSGNRGSVRVITGHPYKAANKGES